MGTKAPIDALKDVIPAKAGTHARISERSLLDTRSRSRLEPEHDRET